MSERYECIVQCPEAMCGKRVHVPLDDILCVVIEGGKALITANVDDSRKPECCNPNCEGTGHWTSVATDSGPIAMLRDLIPEMVIDTAEESDTKITPLFKP